MANEPNSNEELTRKEEKAVEKERADSANAENIRNAAEVAIASKKTICKDEDGKNCFIALSMLISIYIYSFFYSHLPITAWL